LTVVNATTITAKATVSATATTGARNVELAADLAPVFPRCERATDCVGALG
jgi:hypothetical protein